MFNSYNTAQRVNINSVTGTISKTCEKSFFKYATIGSCVFNSLMDSNPKIVYDNRWKNVVVLQSMIIAEKTMMFELIWENDFNQLKESENNA